MKIRQMGKEWISIQKRKYKTCQRLIKAGNLNLNLACIVKKCKDTAT